MPPDQRDQLATRLLAGFVALFGLVCMGIALGHIAIGPAVIPAPIPVNATMDSEDRFYATLFLGFGLALVWCARDLEPRRDVFFALLAIFFVGGIARIISWIQVGPPIALFIFLGALGGILGSIVSGMMSR